MTPYLPASSLEKGGEAGLGGPSPFRGVGFGGGFPVLHKGSLTVAAVIIVAMGYATAMVSIHHHPVKRAH
jgi:hypothetical protein